MHPSEQDTAAAACEHAGEEVGGPREALAALPPPFLSAKLVLAC